MSLSNYPGAIDTDANLYLVHDALRTQLADDYNPGDTSITVNSDPIVANFPPTGIITLTEQCSDIGLRASSFTYTSHTATTFDGLVILPGFTDIVKPKRITDVTLNVVAEHHNALKDALIAIETFVGVQGDISLVPLKGTMEARINFLRKLVLQPRAWFTVNKRIGIIPLCIQFSDFSTREPLIWDWNFGDGTSQIISRTATTLVGDISKCYFTPGMFTVNLTVSNSFGVNSVTLPNYIVARVQAPNPVTITFAPQANQIYANGVLRSTTNQLINIMIASSGQQPLDPILKYTWDLTDDLTHDNSSVATASYSIGGIYDVEVRTDTTLGAYRITDISGAIDIIEQVNLWHFIFDPNAPAGSITKNLFTYEFGTISETYKVVDLPPTVAVTRNPAFLAGRDEPNRQTSEFLRNNGFTPKTLVSSGNQGNCLLWWSEGGVNYTDPQIIRFRELAPFDQIWITPTLGTGNDTIPRQWNWLSLASASNVYFLFGNVPSGVGSPTNQTLTTLALLNYNVGNATLTSQNYLNGANELMNNVGGGSDGDFSVYRGTWQDPTGFFVRNDGTGVFFRLRSFYHTEGILSQPIQFIRKLNDMAGSTKFEGQMVALTNGIYFFNNTGEVSVYNPTTNIWTTGGPGINSPVFTQLQDTSVVGFDSPNNTLLAAGDSNHVAYLSYDYSVKAFMKFNEIDMTFTTLPIRPSGEQFTMGVF